jgi:2-polyprenyl-3-methyl-5-hydroxy-6-metoxy-1,4-benzoquinol methylase
LFQSTCDNIHEEYARRYANPVSIVGKGVRATRRLQEYERAFRELDLLPFAGKRVLDVGCGHEGWLEQCCRLWGAHETDCFGVDLYGPPIEVWREEHPESQITMRVAPAHQLEFLSGHFDIVHQCGMFSSNLDGALRVETASAMWRKLAPGGHLLWIDFWINPFNPRTVPMHIHTVRHLFPTARMVYHRRITLAPPVGRVLSRISDSIIPMLESVKVFNVYHFIVLRNDAVLR